MVCILVRFVRYAQPDLYRSILDLPNELLDEVVTCVPTQHILKNAALLCKRLNVAANRLLYRLVEISTQRSFSIFLHAITQCCDRGLGLYVKSLRLHPRVTAGYVDWDQVHIAMAQMEYLEEFRVGRFVAPPFLYHRFNLRVLQTESCTGRLLEFAMRHSKLQHLCLGHRLGPPQGLNTQFTPTYIDTITAPLFVLENVMQFCPRLKRVRMAGPAFATTIRSNFLNKLPASHGIEELMLFIEVLLYPSEILTAICTHLPNIQHLGIITLQCYNVRLIPQDA